METINYDFSQTVKQRRRKIIIPDWSSIDKAVTNIISKHRELKHTVKKKEELQVGKIYTFDHREKGIVEGRLIFHRENYVEVFTDLGDFILFSLDYTDEVKELEYD